jgi:hypothetical protein
VRQSVGTRVRAHWQRWFVVVLVVSALGIIHPYVVSIFNFKHATGDRFYFRDGSSSYEWQIGTAWGHHFLFFVRYDNAFEEQSQQADAASHAPPGWAPFVKFDLATQYRGNFYAPRGLIYGFGFPFVSTRSAYMWLADGSVRSIGINRSLGSSVDAPWPTWVYWPGMILNLLVWNAAGLTLFILFDGLVGLRRLRRGRCVICSYDIGVGASMCPECGTGSSPDQNEPGEGKNKDRLRRSGTPGSAPESLDA